MQSVIALNRLMETLVEMIPPPTFSVSQHAQLHLIAYRW
jgi:hypothetical protein